MEPPYGLLLLIVALAGYACLSKSSKYSKVPAYADRMCSHDQIEFQTVTGSVISCVATCSDKPGCRSLVYLPGNKTCYGIKTDYPFGVSSLPLPGAAFYKDASKAYYGEECSATRACVETRTTCFAGLGRCVCDPYTSNYNEATKTCTQGCVSYSDQFQRYPQYVLMGHDAECSYGETSVTACLQRCAQASTYTCHSTDYRCVSYSDQFQRYPQYVLMGYDEDCSYGETSVTACLQRCAQASSYTCHSTDYHPGDGRCCYSGTHMLSVVSGSLVAHADMEFHARHCLN